MRAWRAESYPALSDFQAIRYAEGVDFTVSLSVVPRESRSESDPLLIHFGSQTVTAGVAGKLSFCNDSVRYIAIYGYTSPVSPRSFLHGAFYVPGT